MSEDKLQESSPELNQEVPKAEKPKGRPKKAEAKDSDKMVEVKEKDLNKLFERLERLEFAASKAGLSKYDTAHKEALGKIIHLRLLDGKVVLRWEVVRDLVEKDTQGRWNEDQQIKLTFEDGKQETMPMIYFTRRYTNIDAEVLSETINRDPLIIEEEGDRTFNVKTVDDRVYSIGSNFIN